MKKAGRVLIAGINGFVGTHLNLKLSNLHRRWIVTQSPVDHSKSQLNICLEELEAKETEPLIMWLMLRAPLIIRSFMTKVTNFG